MKRLFRIVVPCLSVAVFLLGAVNLYPCVAGANTAQSVKKSCHTAKADSEKTHQDQKKSEKPCCSLHCYNPANIAPFVAIAPPATVTLAIAHETLSYFSLTITPLIPPPQA